MFLAWKYCFCSFCVAILDNPLYSYHSKQLIHVCVCDNISMSYQRESLTFTYTPHVMGSHLLRSAGIAEMSIRFLITRQFGEGESAIS